MAAPRATPESAWYGHAPSPALLPLSWLYGAGTQLHRALYERGPLAPEHLPARVVAVGNVVAGGAGKTPVVAWLAQRARAAGRQDVNRMVGIESERVSHLTARLATLGPAATLARGYAVVQVLAHPHILPGGRSGL